MAVAEHARRKHRDGDEQRVWPVLTTEVVVRQRHFGGVELIELEHAPENLGGLQDSGR